MGSEMCIRDSSSSRRRGTSCSRRCWPCQRRHGQHHQASGRPRPFRRSAMTSSAILLSGRFGNSKWPERPSQLRVRQRAAGNACNARIYRRRRAERPRLINTAARCLVIEGPPCLPRRLHADQVFLRSGPATWRYKHPVRGCRHSGTLSASPRPAQVAAEEDSTTGAAPSSRRLTSRAAPRSPFFSPCRRLSLPGNAPATFVSVCDCPPLKQWRVTSAGPRVGVTGARWH